MRIKEIMEATPGNGPASATQVKPPAAARPATPAPKPGSQVIGQTKTNGAMGTTTTNKAQGQAPTASDQAGKNKINQQQMQQMAQGKTPTGLK
jgi:hypothetical protein